MIPINPEAIGDPDQTPVVYLGEEVGKALGICQRTAPDLSTPLDPAKIQEWASAARSYLVAEPRHAAAVVSVLDYIPPLLAALAKVQRRLRALEATCGCRTEAKPDCHRHGEMRILLDDLDSAEKRLAKAQRERDEWRLAYTPWKVALMAERDAALAEVERTRRAGYAEAVAALRDDARYINWWSSSDCQPDGPIRYHLAGYLETVGPDGRNIAAAVDTYESQDGTDG